VVFRKTLLEFSRRSFPDRASRSVLKRFQRAWLGQTGFPMHAAGAPSQELPESRDSAWISVSAAGRYLRRFVRSRRERPSTRPRGCRRGLGFPGAISFLLLGAATTGHLRPSQFPRAGIRVFGSYHTAWTLASQAALPLWHALDRPGCAYLGVSEADET